MWQRLGVATISRTVRPIPAYWEMIPLTHSLVNYLTAHALINLAISGAPPSPHKYGGEDEAIGPSFQQYTLGASGLRLIFLSVIGAGEVSSEITSITIRSVTKF
uniref:Uncharacterized protein n=1 Tax=Cacopsylla melanoneura TaxID=428564 RepID=A0A8D9F7N2_9HEMI